MRLQVGHQRPGREGVGRERELPGRDVGGVLAGGLHLPHRGASLEVRRRSGAFLSGTGFLNH